MHFCFFKERNGCFPKQSGCSRRQLRCSCRFFCKGVFYILGVLLFQALLCSADGSPAPVRVYQPEPGGAEESGSEAAGDGEERQGALFMTIYDENGAKRLLSSKHPARIAQGIYFVFPDDAQDYEICRNGGGWKKAGRQTYVMPPAAAEDALCVQFRAKTGGGSMHYSRSFVLIRETDSHFLNRVGE